MADRADVTWQGFRPSRRVPGKVSFVVVLLSLQTFAQAVEVLRPLLQLAVPVDHRPATWLLWLSLLRMVAVVVVMVAIARHLLRGRSWTWAAALLLETIELVVRIVSAVTFDPIDGVGPLLGMLIPVAAIAALCTRELREWVGVTSTG